MTAQWSQVAVFFAAGAPKPQPRPRARAIRAAGKWIATIYNPHDADDWKRSVAWWAIREAPPAPLVGAVRVDLMFLLPRPDRLMRVKDPEGPVLCPCKPDVDNLAKAVLDAMTDTGRWWRDDGQVCDGQWRKLYAGKHRPTGVWVRVHQAVSGQVEMFAGEPG